MNESILKQIRNDYLERKNEQINCKNLQKRLQDLEENPIVKEYLSLLEEIEEVDLKKTLSTTDEKMINSSFRNYIYKIKETNEIYVYMGTFKSSDELDIVHGPSDERVARDDQRAQYRNYRNIETDDDLQIPIKESDEFEKNHSIIFPRTCLPERYFYELQREFFKDAVLSGQKEAVKKVLKKSNKK